MHASRSMQERRALSTALLLLLNLTNHASDEIDGASRGGGATPLLQRRRGHEHTAHAHRREGEFHAQFRTYMVSSRLRRSNVRSRP
jgi:hypothetical protein